MAGISPTISTGPFVGNGVATAFAADFTVASAAEIAVYVGGVEISPALYGVTVNPSGIPTVTFATPPSSGATVLLVSDPDFTQVSEFEGEGDYNLSTVNKINQRQAVRTNWLARQIARLMPASLLAGTSLAGKFLAWDASGDPVAASGTGADAGLRTDLAGVNGSALAGFIGAGAGAIARTAQAKMRETVSVKDFGATGDGATDDTSAIAAAITYARATAYQEKLLVFPAGDYRVSQINLRDCSNFALHAEGTVNITGIDGSKGWIVGDDRLDKLGHVETFTRSLRMTGGPWLIGAASGQTYARGLKLQNFVDCVFENVSVSGTFTPTGGTGDRIGVEINLSFNNAFRNCSFGYPGAPIGGGKSYGVWLGSDNANNNRFYSCRAVGGGSGVASTFGVRVDSSGNAFYGIDISSIHTAFELNAARGALFINTYHEAVSRVCSVSFASTGCVFQPSYVDIAANGTAWDLSGAQTVGFQIIGGNHRFSPTGTTGLAKGINTYGLTYQPGIADANQPATGATGNDNGSGGLPSFNDYQLAASKIAFPDTPVASSNATTLDAYKEGTATASGTGTVSLSSGILRYTKIGNIVHLRFGITFPTNSDTANDARITGLPFTAHASDLSGGSPGQAIWPVNHAVIVSGGNIYIVNRTTGAVLKNADCSGNSYYGSITYEAAV